MALPTTASGVGMPLGLVLHFFGVIAPRAIAASRHIGRGRESESDCANHGFNDEPDFKRMLRRRLMNRNSKSTILVVDDEFDCCQNLADILGDLNYDVDTACSGALALQLAEKKQYDVALLDLKMPGMDGLTLYRQIRKIQPGTVAIIVTAYASDPTTQEALQAGAWQVLSKPVDLTELLPLVDDAVKQPLVLVVDDDEALCDNLWDILRDRRLRVGLAHTEQEAIQHLTSQDYQVVLVDLKLPDGDGRNVLRMLEEDHPECRTVLITGHPGEYEDVISAALNHGADAVCYKPFDLRALLATIERLVRRKGPQE